MQLPPICSCKKKKCLWHLVSVPSPSQMKIEIEYDDLYKGNTVNVLLEAGILQFPSTTTTSNVKEEVMLNALIKTVNKTSEAVCLLSLYRQMCIDKLSKKWIDQVAPTVTMVWERSLITLLKISLLCKRLWPSERIFGLLYKDGMKNYADTLYDCMKRVDSEIQVILDAHVMYTCENSDVCEKSWLVPKGRINVKEIQECCLCKDPTLKFCSKQCFNAIWNSGHGKVCTRKHAITKYTKEEEKHIQHTDIYLID